MSIVEAICAMPDTTRFCAFVKDLTDGPFSSGLDPNTNYTVFAPDDQAFAIFGDASSVNITEKDANRMLEFHFYENMYLTYDELACSEKLLSMSGNDTSRTKCDTLDGTDGTDDVTIVKYQNGNGNTKHGSMPKIVTKDVLACNGIIHSINHIMFPVFLKEYKETDMPVEPSTDMPVVDDDDDDVDGEPGTKSPRKTRPVPRDEGRHLQNYKMTAEEKKEEAQLENQLRSLQKKLEKAETKRLEAEKEAEGRLTTAMEEHQEKEARNAKEVVDLAAAAAAASLSTKSDDDDLTPSPVNDEPGTKSATRKRQSVALQHLQNYKMTAEEHDSIIII
ncbi:hypothetical protein FRACYDRAFT_252523 [Fragilariopsis cylindrus CCMP1102]|uniref:FAS1 domain-containing protein n=1 Tax=Fragilariopsis cylindrus CCMP1102 TaxID=635003 RepID=A0A1E7EMU0_9STRA|nr:hypothetical protein FRACYDRAFT_252523 [Fragilariopsis cylindrus CCMP1102]|eukprot:OEU06893.1 hypothetical protein FRACYDRAFT_252523 [Fragilariopsis cylindrus CCMP1102]